MNDALLEVGHGLEWGVGKPAAVGAGADDDSDRDFEGRGINRQDQLQEDVLASAGRVTMAVAAGSEFPTEI